MKFYEVPIGCIQDEELSDFTNFSAAWPLGDTAIVVADNCSHVEAVELRDDVDLAANELPDPEDQQKVRAFDAAISAANRVKSQINNLYMDESGENLTLEGEALILELQQNIIDVLQADRDAIDITPSPVDSVTKILFDAGEDPDRLLRNIRSKIAQQS